MTEVVNTPDEGELVVVTVKNVKQNTQALKGSFLLGKSPVDGSKISGASFVMDKG